MERFTKEDLISSSEAIEILGVSRVTLSNYVHRGLIEPITRGTFVRQEVEELSKEYPEKKGK